MPLEQVNLARSSTEEAAPEKFTATPEEISTIEEKMKDPVFRELMHDYMRSLEDPETRKEEEAYLEQAEREAREGGDFSFEFVFPRANYVIELLEPSPNTISVAEARQCGRTGPTEALRGRSFLNFCSSDKVRACTERTTGDRQASNWEVPVTASQRRVEVYNPVAGSSTTTIPSSYAAPTDIEAASLCIVHDVVFHPNTLQLGEQSGRFLSFLVEIAVEQLNHGYKEGNGFRFQRLPGAVASIGTPQNQTLRMERGRTPFSVDPKDPVLQGPTKHLPTAPAAPKYFSPATFVSAANKKKGGSAADTTGKASGKRAITSASNSSAAAASPSASSSTLAAESGEEKTEQLPPHTITHRGSIDLTDAWRWTVSEKRIGVPEELVVTMTFEGVCRAAAIDVSVCEEGRRLRLDRTEAQTTYAGLLPLPFAVEEVPRRAQFDRTRGVLTLVLGVVPPPLPEGGMTAEELRRTLPGALAEKKEEEERVSEKKSADAHREGDAQGKPAETEQVEEVSERVRETADSPDAPPPPPSSSAAPSPAGGVSSGPELSHIANQDRVGAMMAQVAAARAAREAAASAANTRGKEDTEEGKEKEKRDVSQAAETTSVAAPLTKAATSKPSTTPAVEKTGKMKREAIMEEEILFIRKKSQRAAPEERDDDVSQVRARQQAWAAMMEAELQVNKAHEEAGAAQAAKAAAADAAKARRRLAAEKEQVRLHALAEAKRQSVPLSNKYIFAID